METTLTETLIERVDALIQASKTPPAWGSPHLSVTPITMRVDGLSAKLAALDKARREIALEVDQLSARA